MSDDASRENRIERAVRRLDRAATLLDQRISRRIAEAEAQGGSLMDGDRARLATELDAARSRERELEAAGAEASEALARAIAELRAAIGDDVSGPGRASGVGRVTLDINGKPYVVGCEDGGEPHARALAARIDAKVRQIAPDAGAPGEARLHPHGRLDDRR